MEEKDSSLDSAQDENIESADSTKTSEEKTSEALEQSQPKVSDKKSHKLLFGILIALGILTLLFALIAPAMKMLNINPEEKFAEATFKQCKEECVSSKDAQCANKCMQSHDLNAYVTPIKISPTSIASPTPTLAPTPIVKKITYAPKASPTPAGQPVLTVQYGFDKSTDPTYPPPHTITLENTNTGKITTRSGSDWYVAFYDLEPGKYRISTSEVSGYHTSYAEYDGHTMGIEHWGNTAYRNVDKGRTEKVMFGYYDQKAYDSVPH